jgi:hypothetical protein
MTPTKLPIFLPDGTKVEETAGPMNPLKIEIKGDSIRVTTETTTAEFHGVPFHVTWKNGPKPNEVKWGE